MKHSSRYIKEVNVQIVDDDIDEDDFAIHSNNNNHYD